MNPTANSFVISSPMALCFPSSKRCRHYFTGLEPGLIFKACSVTSLGMPGMSEGFHANMSIGTEEDDERAFLFGGKCGTNAHHFTLGTAGVYEDLLGALH